MLLRLLPGMLVAALLALLFGTANPPAKPPEPVAPERREPDLSERVLFPAAPAATLSEREMEKWLPDPDSFGFDNFIYEEETVLAETPSASGEVSPTPPAAAPALLARIENEDDGAPRGSETAYASMASPPGFSGAADLSRVPSGDLPPLLRESLAASSPAQPLSRSLRVRASGEILRARQKPSLFDNAAYTLTGRRYSAGLDYDWSVDTVVGAGVEMLDATVKSGHRHDSRRTGVSGLFASASLDTVLFRSYLLGFKGFYGRLDSEASGSVGAWDDGGATTTLWREAEHDSRMYGLSGTVRVPLLFWGQRVVFDAGVEYARIDTGRHDYELAAGGTASAEALSSSSLAFPVTFSMERDFLTRWALVTPRLSAGYAHETSDSAGGVRAFNSLSALPLPYHSAGFHSTPPPFVSTQKFYHFGLGLDVRTTGGWNLALDYRRDFANAYSRDSLAFELGRSF